VRIIALSANIMALDPGTRIGGYEILALLGSGGMGEVYRAKDTKLGRDVAIKVLPELFVSDPERVARFQREAKTLASLNHPHIGGIYGLEDTDGVCALVLELVEGPTLADCLQRGAMRAQDALPIACQIADALEAAHEQGIVHRDLKPANVKLAADNKVKVLDFGLAKAMEKTPASATVANSPTLSVLATQAGIIMGTAAYMSPEQAKGADTDRRSDIWSFGVVLYEMLTARQPFHGETAAEIMAAVLIREADLEALPGNLHPRIRELITRCLDKQPKKRWQAMGDLRLELESLVAAPYRTDAPASAALNGSPWWKRALPLTAAVALTAAATTFANRWLSTPRAADIVRFSFPAQDFRTGSSAIAISPDGRHVVYVGTTGTDRSQLMLRDMADTTSRPIAGTAIRGAVAAPAFSPDGHFVVYFTIDDRSLKKIAVTGGAAMTLCTLSGAPVGGISWRGDTIVVAQNSGIFKVSANGGEPELAVRTDSGSTASSPQIIDDSGSMLFALTHSEPVDLSSRWDRAQIVLQTSDGARHILLSGGAEPHYLPTGYLVYALGGSLLATRVDPARGRILGTPVPVVEGVARSATSLTAHAAVSSGGTLAFVAGPVTASSARTLGLIDLREGKVQPLPIPPNAYGHPRVSPDGHLAAVASDDGKEGVVWIYDLIGRGPPRRLTFAGRSTMPIWTPDGRFVTYQSDQQGGQGLFLQRADGTGPVERLTKAEPGSQHFPDSWTPDGKVLAFRVQSATGSIWTVARDGDRRPKPLIQMKDRSQVATTFSPDGRWIAYGSNELTGIGYQVFVQPFPPDGTTKFQAEAQTGSVPVWSRDGKRLVFALGNRLFALDVRTSPTFSAGQPTEVGGTFATLISFPAVRNFDLMPDGDQLLVVLTSTENQAAPDRGQQINVVLNWVEELKQRVPTK
jgi:eukaryotic-like serine/threonine-protein kinase